jgi:VIT1/CCC1 family predicted Fe2+/Mn2+ transporter
MAMQNSMHPEEHFTATDLVRDVVIGMSDGLTVPFALAAGLSGAVSTVNVIVVAGIAEIAAGSIAMGLGGFLAGRTDAEHYGKERAREFQEVEQFPEQEADEVAQIFRSYGLGETELKPLVAAILSDPERWVEFMLRYELGLEEPDPARALRSAVTIAVAYILGGLIPLSPYIFSPDVGAALPLSVAITLLALFIFGFFKNQVTGLNPLRGGFQTMLIGGVAAGAAFGLARLVGS